jgi:hypothetical protein
MDKYEAISKLGEGSYGQIWRCVDKVSGRVVAVKMFKEAHRNEEVRWTGELEGWRTGVAKCRALQRWRCASCADPAMRSPRGPAAPLAAPRRDRRVLGGVPFGHRCALQGGQGARGRWAMGGLICLGGSSSYFLAGPGAPGAQSQWAPGRHTLITSQQMQRMGALTHGRAKRSLGAPLKHCAQPQAPCSPKPQHLSRGCAWPLRGWPRVGG